MAFDVSNDWLFCPQPRPQASIRLFCFPYAGGGVAPYRTWAKYVSSDIEILAIRLPGRDGRMGEKPVSNLGILVEVLAEALGPRISAPFAFYGHSLGALISYELVRQLRRRGKSLPQHLFVAARRAPHVPSRDTDCHQLPDPAFIDTLIQRYNGIPPAVLAEPELMNLFLPVLRADFTLMETYQHASEDLLEIPITVFGGMQDRVVPRNDLDAWKDLTTATTQVHMIDGDHFFLQTAQPTLLNVIAQKLAM
jgi:medium-chain acyl-[acyl-carrier-protein] hydrolase